jgi:GR25 family glycosyltransferase involved in LPS biosynthesis
MYLSYVVYVLTLEGSTRSQQLLSQGNELGLTLNLCLGVKGQGFSDDEFKRLAPARQAEFILGRSIGKNELACVLGHIEIYQKFLENDSAAWCLVLEDDAKISPGLIEFVADTSEFPKNSIIHLSPQLNLPNVVLRTKVFKETKNSIKINQVLDFVPRTHGYLIDREAASTALRISQQDTYYFTADWPLNWIREVDFWVTSETLVDTLEADLGSDISEERIQLERYRNHEPFMRLLGRIRFLNWGFNGLGVTAIYGKILGIPFKVTFQEFFLMPLRRKWYRSQAK